MASIASISPSYKHSPLRTIRLPVLTRLQNAVKLYIIKFCVGTYITLTSLLSRFCRYSPNLPTYTLSPAHTSLARPRVFIPQTHTPDSPPLPLLIDIHGGGFCIGAPLFDDSDNAILSQKHGICVVSIGYRLAPKHRFPTPVEDVVAGIKAVLKDESLPVDKTRVALAGYSAGANLALAASQTDGMRGRIKGVVAYYAPTDFVRTAEERIRPGIKAPRWGDPLKVINWGYVPVGTDRYNPLLSPLHAKRQSLPEKVYLLGCEYDILCEEASDMAERMAEGEMGEMVEDEVGEGWKKGGVRWRKVLGMNHAFNQTGWGTKEIEAAEEMHADVARWLKREVYA